MFKSIRTAVLSVLIALGTVAGVSAPASAGDVRIVAGSGGIYFGFGDHYNRGHRYGPRHYRPAYRDRGVCHSGQAVREASRRGLRRAHIVRRTRHSVTVAGRYRGYHTIKFANVRGCPRIR